MPVRPATVVRFVPMGTVRSLGIAKRSFAAGCGQAKRTAPALLLAPNETLALACVARFFTITTRAGTFYPYEVGETH